MPTKTKEKTTKIHQETYPKCKPDQKTKPLVSHKRGGKKKNLQYSRVESRSPYGPNIFLSN